MQVGDLVECNDGQLMLVMRISKWRGDRNVAMYRNAYGLVAGQMMIAGQHLRADRDVPSMLLDPKPVQRRNKK